MWHSCVALRTEFPRKSMFPAGWVVLPDRIELSTSPLPMECSTTELRQHVLVKNRAPEGAYQAGRYLPQAPLLCKLARPVKTRKSGRYRGQNAHFGSKLPAFRRFAFRSSPANWPGGHATGFGPFRVSHDPIARSLLSCRNLWAWYRRRQYRTP